MVMEVGELEGAGALRQRRAAACAKSRADGLAMSARMGADAAHADDHADHDAPGDPLLSPHLHALECDLRAPQALDQAGASADTLQAGAPCACLGARQAGREQWLRSYTLLRELVRDCGGTLIEDRVDSANATCAYSTFVGRTNNRYRLRWNIKERFGMLQVAASDSNWEDVVEVHKNPTGSYTNFRPFIEAAERLAGRRLG